MANIIGLLGMSKVGKDVIGDVFIKNGYKRYAFGDAVKEQYAEISGYPLVEMFNERKEFHRPEIINLGESARRTNPSYWVDYIEEKLLDDFHNGVDIVITDIRRIPELQFFKNLQIVLKNNTNHIELIEVQRPLFNGGTFDPDAETSHAIVYANYNKLVFMHVLNTGSIEDLEIKTLDFVSRIKK